MYLAESPDEASLMPQGSFQKGFFNKSSVQGWALFAQYMNGISAAINSWAAQSFRIEQRFFFFKLFEFDHFDHISRQIRNRAPNVSKVCARKLSLTRIQLDPSEARRRLAFVLEHRVYCANIAFAQLK